MVVKFTGTLHSCGGCLAARRVRRPIPKQTATRSDTTLGHILIDPTGSKKTKAPSGKRYVIVFRDDFSRYTRTYFLSKSETATTLETFMPDTRIDGSVDILRTDRGTEFKGPFQVICERLHITREVTPADSPQFNGCVERDIVMLE